MRWTSIVAGGLLLSAACRQTPARATPTSSSTGDPVITLALVNGRIWTGDPSRAAADAIAIAGDRIAAVGTTAEIRAKAGTAETIDLAGAFVTPGFIDSHVHFLDGGFRLASVQLRDVATREVFVARIKAFAATVPQGTWIRAATGITRCGAATPAARLDRRGDAGPSRLDQSPRRPHGAREHRRAACRGR
jgi:imidazolonepropionase-like amidohydrolase